MKKLLVMAMWISAGAAFGGISCISVSGHRAPQNMYDQSLEPLIDNLRVSHYVPGFVFSIR